MPTNCTGERWLAAAEKNVPDPPSTLSALPKGVSTESSATEPTTRTDIGRRRRGRRAEANYEGELRGLTTATNCGNSGDEERTSSTYALERKFPAAPNHSSTRVAPRWRVRGGHS